MAETTACVYGIEIGLDLSSPSIRRIYLCERVQISVVSLFLAGASVPLILCVLRKFHRADDRSMEMAEETVTQLTAFGSHW